MTIKKKVTYSVSYTAGTDTLTTKLNSLLQDIVTLILTQNTGLTVLDTITVGSSRFTGAPLFDTYVSGLYSGDYQNRHYESDVYFLGTNEDNVCLSIGFFNGALVIAMNMSPKVEKEYTDNWAAMGGGSYLPFYAIGKESRWFPTTDSILGNYVIPYAINNNAISMGIIYWTGEASRGYIFMNGLGQSDGVSLIIFATDEGQGQTGLGAAIHSYGTANQYRSAHKFDLTVFSFSEDISHHKPAGLDSETPGLPPPIYSAATQQEVNARYDWRSWHNIKNSAAYASYTSKPFATMHTLGGSMGSFGNNSYSFPAEMPQVLSASAIEGTADANKAFLSILCSAYNLPRLNPGQAYIRKMRIPGWNPECKGEIYLLWSPVLTAYQSGDIVEVGSKSYAIITEGAVCWAARVS